jgi:hypothetical protein
MTNHTRLGNPNIRPGSLRDRAARANAEREAQKRWPENQSNAETTRLSQAGNKVSPSTGSNAPAKTNVQRELTPRQKDFIAQEAASIKNDNGMNPEYKKAYLEALEQYPPRTNTAQSQQTARQVAELRALQTAPRYTAQTRTVDNGVIVDRANLSRSEPAPPPTREGNTLVTPKVNDAKGNAIATTQVQREQQQQANRYRNKDY